MLDSDLTELSKISIFKKHLKKRIIERRPIVIPRRPPERDWLQLKTTFLVNTVEMCPKKNSDVSIQEENGLRGELAMTEVVLTFC